MDLDSDLRLRLAVFDPVSRLRHEHGGVIPSRRLSLASIRTTEFTFGATFARFERNLRKAMGHRRVRGYTGGNGVLDEIEDPKLRHGLQELDGGRIQLPRRVGLKPRRDDLAERFERFNAA